MTLNRSPQRDPNGRKLSLAKQVADDIVRQLDCGEILPGTRLPWRDELCRRYGVSSITVRAAIADLIAQGRLESRWRGGIFAVAPIPPTASSAERTIAFITQMADNPFVAQILSGAGERATYAGYQLVVVPTGSDYVHEARLITDLATRVGGLIVNPSTTQQSATDSNISHCATHANVVFVDHYIEDIPAPRATSDNVLGGYLATKHLLEVGCGRIYALTAGRFTTSARERLKGYTQALDEQGILFDPSRMRHSPGAHYEAAQELMSGILDREQSSGRLGIFAINDAIAAGAYVAIKHAGLRIPEDVAVVGFDDIHGQVMDPPLTSIRQDLAAMGRAAVGLMLDLIAGRPTTNVLTPVQLIVRASTTSLT